jgi:hypothetical protein
MDDADLYNEAEDCRRRALSYLGRPEAPFLLRVAREFERLSAKRHRGEGVQSDDELTPTDRHHSK